MSGHEIQGLQMLKAFWEEAGKSLYFRTSQMTESDSTTLKQSKVRSNAGKNFLTVKTLKLWKLLFVEGLESPPLKTFENRLRKILSKIM